MGLLLAGTITSKQGTPIKGASVRLAGEPALLGKASGAVTVPPRGAVSWARRITGFAGTRWAAWEEYVKDRVPGISWNEFAEQVLQQNPDLAADKNIFKADKQYLLPQPVAVVTWSRPLSGFAGSRWNVWEQFVKDQVVGITWNEFAEQALIQNPHLTADKNIFKADKSYRLPENLPGGVGVVWNRTLTGFSGNRWQCWETHLKDQIEGMTFNEFAEAALAQNPALAADKNIFKAEKSYWLPANVGKEVAYLLGWSDESGRYQLDVPTAGSYEFSVHASGYDPHRERLALSSALARTVILSPTVAKAQPTPSPTPQPTPPVTQNTQGFIQSASGNFILNNRPLRFVGVNIRGLPHYGDPALLPHSHAGHASLQLEAAREMGARVVRVFLANRHTSTQETLSRLERALTQAEAYDMYVIVAFTDVHGDTGFNPPGDTKFYQDGRLGKAFYQDGYRENYLPLVEQAVGRFKNHRRIFAWELGNELKAWEPGRIIPELFIEFARTVSTRIRAIDPTHLIGTGVINSGNLGTTPQQAEQLYRIPALDFLTAHIYYGVEDAGRDAGELENQRLEAARAEQDAALAQRLKKPFIIEEIGFCGGDRAAQTQQQLDKWYDQKGASGCMQWGLMATDHDMGDGDRRFGMDRKFNAQDYGGLLNVFKQRAARL